MSVIQYLNLANAAKHVGVSVTKLYRFIHSGDLPVYRKDGELVISVEDLMMNRSEINDCEIFEPTFMNLILEVKEV